ncbi:hypothetical protein P1X14_13720 [Sphingomonas sp. AOB5]|uniref:hypothetical protein n=1 Tax=Sphingomonas sp. AOB5 TaxID=3034017 RepID=UPI0023F7D928|nr:hypothetical protein [Sphingomonas sp. AOB5]MDF7776309.1 hypothetical protein [Sphingomonas sp. AOB5]
MRAAILFATALLAASPVSAQGMRHWALGRPLFDTVFDPERNFPDLEKGGDDQMILTVQTSARDDMAPAISLAIAYRCITISPTSCQPTYTARMLRVAPEASQFEASVAMLVRLSKASNDGEARSALDASNLEWVEADVLKCDGGLDALEGVRKADWSPDLHYKLRAEPEIIMHPAMIRVTMRGDVTTSSYRGWVLAPGVPAAVRTLIATLDKCWKPSSAPKPWASGPIIR